MKKKILQLLAQKQKKFVRGYYEQLQANKLKSLQKMTTFLETYNLPRLNHDKIGNLKRPIMDNGIEIIV